MKNLLSYAAFVAFVAALTLVALFLWVAFVKWAYDYTGWPFA